MHFMAGRTLLVAFAVAWIAAGAGSASADVIYATTIDSNTLQSLDFGTLNTNTGVFTSIGLLNTKGGIFAMGYASNGQLEGISYSGEIYAINTANAATTAVGQIQFNNAVDVIGGEAVGGTFYLVSDSASVLYTVTPPSSLTPTILGGLTNSTATMDFSAAGLVATSPTGALYMATSFEEEPNKMDVNDLLLFNHPLPRLSTVIGDLGAPVGAGLFLGNTLYGITYGNQIVTIDTSTGASTPIANINIDPSDGIGAVAPLSTTPVPGSLTMLVIGAAMALLTRRRWSWCF
jgi:hypothetical protein